MPFAISILDHPDSLEVQLFSLGFHYSIYLPGPISYVNIIFRRQGFIGSYLISHTAVSNVYCFLSEWSFLFR